MDSPTLLILADSQSTFTSSGPLGGLGGYLIAAIVLLFVFKKADERPWAGFVPIYNLYVYTRVAGYNPWLFLLFLVPLVNVVFWILVSLRIARAFGHGGAFGFFLIFLPPLSLIGHLIVGLSSDTYDRNRI